MPIYEYQCTECGKTFEVFQKISDEPLTECKVCKGKLTKLISNCAFHLKGTGWYVTDYKKPIDTVGGGKNGSKHVEKTESAPEPATVTETKTDTKAETASTASTGGAA
ncbi:MAG: Zinc ribbon domain protein [Syntrophorhabdus sp. PtaB.Bin184]|jgi:putative FmdB family regulatory protein|nr:MAG: Zinc ribbon domain protein [Syntrophorhabdus sp. PtaB.Bin184]